MLDDAGRIELHVRDALRRVTASFHERSAVSESPLLAERYDDPALPRR
ncbi:hypothetical protein ENKNEFLB_01758 [Nocardioides aquaticus]|uniref:Uncharacterized protein n=1 Tax=Nocardioides aquaticus TaxID=160826 RepID=A0ABX8EFT4_9ACTN|nr:hypothetical protein [Nocardioides aquaticus]QVT79377.1 hypothetical protein ENKNEFLB_01758 [Nocardioides aquaticus]